MVPRVYCIEPWYKASTNNNINYCAVRSRFVCLQTFWFHSYVCISEQEKNLAWELTMCFVISARYVKILLDSFSSFFPPCLYQLKAPLKQVADECGLCYGKSSKSFRVLYRVLAHTF